MNDTLSGHHGPVHTFAFAVGTPNLAFHTIQLADPMPTARQILDADGAHPADEHVVLALLPNGATEALRLDEDIRSPWPRHRARDRLQDRSRFPP